jgi:hypothetical protein
LQFLWFLVFPCPNIPWFVGKIHPFKNIPFTYFSILRGAVPIFHAPIDFVSSSKCNRQRRRVSSSLPTDKKPKGDNFLMKRLPWVDLFYPDVPVFSLFSFFRSQQADCRQTDDDCNRSNWSCFTCFRVAVSDCQRIVAFN